MSTISEVAQAFREKLLANERTEISRLVGSYRKVEQRILKRLEDLAGLSTQKPLTVGQLYEQQRLQMFQAQVEQEITAWTKDFGGNLETQQQKSMVLGAEASEQLMQQTGLSKAQMAPFLSTNPTFVEQSVALTQGAGSPLRALLRKIAPDTASAAGEALIQGVATGINPRKTAKKVQEALGTSLTRALVISRTETVRSFRYGQTVTFQENADVLAGWRWSCTLSLRTCGSCLAMNGTFHSIEETLHDHPNGRCVMIPRPKGLPEPELPDSKAWFDALSEADQRTILSTRTLEAYRSGKIPWGGWVEQKVNPKWGNGVGGRAWGRMFDAQGRYTPSYVDQLKKKPVLPGTSPVPAGKGGGTLPSSLRSLPVHEREAAYHRMTLEEHIQAVSAPLHHAYRAGVVSWQELFLDETAGLLKHEKDIDLLWGSRVPKDPLLGTSSLPGRVWGHTFKALDARNKVLWGEANEMALVGLREMQKEGDTLAQGGALFNKWNGNTYAKTKSLMSGASGQKEWNCSILLREDYAFGDNQKNRWSVLLHEQFHGWSPKMTPDQYAASMGLEEGVVENMMRLCFKKWEERGERLCYASYGNYTSSLHMIAQETNLSYEAFDKALLRVPITVRRQKILELTGLDETTLSKPGRKNKAVREALKRLYLKTG
jgi:hypothetical protein